MLNKEPKKFSQSIETDQSSKLFLLLTRLIGIELVLHEIHMKVTGVKLTRRSGWISASLLTAWVLVVTFLIVAQPGGAGATQEVSGAGATQEVSGVGTTQEASDVASRLVGPKTCGP